MSARNLSRVFSKECGVSLIAFLNDARIDAARRYLESTDHPVSSIARRCGFESADTLRRTFSKRLHISPMEYRSVSVRAICRVQEPRLSRPRFRKNLTIGKQVIGMTALRPASGHHSFATVALIPR